MSDHTTHHADCECRPKALNFAARGTADPATLPHAHTKCGKRWAGSITSHCSLCCETFTSVGAFDTHRVKGECANPKALRMVIADGRAYDAWQVSDV